MTLIRRARVTLVVLVALAAAACGDEIHDGATVQVPVGPPQAEFGDQALDSVGGAPTTVTADSVATRNSFPPPTSATHDVTSRVPAGGPAVLYEPPAQVPEIQNHDDRFHAPYELVSGTERYVNGEYLYTDFIYDDEDTTYPADFDRFGNNAADLAEFRISSKGSELAVRLSLTTLLAPDSTIAVVAFDSDQDPSTGNDTLPRDPGLPFPGTDQVLTTWGSGAEWSTWNGSAWESTPLDVVTDLDANQITVTVPKSVADPAGEWSATLAVGLFDHTTGGWLPVDSTHGSDIVNLGFRFDEMERTAPVEGVEVPGVEVYNASPFEHQGRALSAGTPTAYAHVVDFDLLRSRGERDNVPLHGWMHRMFASRLDTVVEVIETSPPGTYVRTPRGEGKNLTSQSSQYFSPLQPYTLYVPDSYDASTPAPLTFTLHGDGVPYWWMYESPHLSTQLGDERNNIVVSPSARGKTGFYVDEMEHGVFETWNHVASHYALDPVRTAITGWSMGGYGTYRLGLLYPHLFSRAVPVVPAQKHGIWIPGITDDHTVVNRWLENARNLPFFHIADAASELTFYPGQLQTAAGPAANGFQSLDSLGYRYKLWSVASDHFLIGTNFPEITEFLADHTIEPEPFHVTYARMPSNDARTLGLEHDQAYWVSDIELRWNTYPTNGGPQPGLGPPATYSKGVIDVVSLGFGKSDPPSSIAPGAGVTAGGLAYVEQARVWGEPGSVPVENKLVINATNIGSVTIDPVAARVDCNVELDITSDGPLDVNLLGCERPDEPIDPAGGLGHVERRSYRTPISANEYLVYTPEGWTEAEQLPLFVLLHGCATTDDVMMQASRLNVIADRERFVVAYPENDAGCWRAVSEDSVLLPGEHKNITRGGGGDADVVAGITRSIIDDYNVDTERVFLAGGSAGAFQTSATAGSYPELYAAIGLIAGPGYGMAVTCAGYSDAAIPQYAKTTVDQMGERAHVMPIFTLAGTVDPLGELGGGVGGCTRLGYLEWLYANNLLEPGDGPLPPGAGVLLPAGDTGDTFQHDPESTETGQVPGGYAWTKHVARDRTGCQIGERWIIDGMGHTWGGDAGDVKGPSTSEALWRFFDKFTLSGGNTACAPE